MGKGKLTTVEVASIIIIVLTVALSVALSVATVYAFIFDDYV